jgi:pilus assembly protein CpaF
MVHKRLLKQLDLRRLDPNLDEATLRARAEGSLAEIIETMQGEGQIPDDVDVAELKQSVLDEALGLGPLEDLLKDDTVSEIMVNGPDHIFVERLGRIERTDKTFTSAQAVLQVIERIVARVGRRIDEASPMVDARLPDGSRVNAIVPPLALKGPCLTIRKFMRETLSSDDLVMKGTLSAEMAEFLLTAVKYRQSIVISGGTGSGKTTTLNVLSSFIPEDERIITIEDAAELKLSQAHVVALETRPPNLEGRGEVAIRDLVRNALRMRPDRIVVGECRGGEALDMLQAMNTGHEGSLTTLHANSPRDALARLETLVLMSGMELPVRAIRDQVASAVSLIVQQARLSDGSRRITHISEVTGLEGEVVTMQDLFVFEESGADKAGKIKGEYKATGQVPHFYETLRQRGVDVDFTPFQG